MRTYEATHAPTTSEEEERIVLAIAAQKGWKFKMADCESAEA